MFSFFSHLNLVRAKQSTRNDLQRKISSQYEELEYLENM